MVPGIFLSTRSYFGRPHVTQLQLGLNSCWRPSGGGARARFGSTWWFLSLVVCTSSIDPSLLWGPLLRFSLLPCGVWAGSIHAGMFFRCGFVFGLRLVRG